MSNVTRRNFLQGLGGMVAICGLSACGGGSSEGGAASAALSPEEAEAAKAEVRKAIRLLFDRQYICDEIAQANQIPASTFVCQGVGEPDGSDFMANAGRGDGQGYYDVAQDALQANFDEAMEILKKYYTYDEASETFTDFPTMTYLYNTDEGHKAIGEYLQSTLAAIGITMNMENQEWATFLNTRKAGDYSIARNGWIMDYTDPISMLDMWTTESGNNDVQFGKGDHAALAMYNLDLTPFGYETKVENGTWADTFDVLIAAIKTEADQEKRFEMMHLAEDMLMETGCLCPLYYYTMVYLRDAEVEGHFSTPLGFNIFKHATYKDGSINVCIASEPDTIDPALNSAVDGATMLTHLFSGLAKWEKQEDGSFAIEPDLAQEMVEGVENEDGSFTYTYKLRDGLTWSDGKPLTAKDFEFAWKRAASEELGADYGYMFDVIKGYPNELAVTAVDDTTLEVTSSNFIAYWNELMAFPTYFPTREDIVSDESWATDPATYVCSGAYTLDGWKHNSLITLKKRAEYWDADNITMDEINFYLSDDQNNILSNFETGAWQFIEGIPTNEMARVKEEYKDEFHVDPYAGTYYVCWNVNENILPA
ncbi:MAG: hypothetical protein IJ203_14315 [Atopobiaceae bacterium]|nr:hypothetical protein [Atopobiaceae bacterium]